jgi:uncharacterized protein YndB with AHSA1/START domain
MQHLEVLEEAHLVLSRREGRTRLVFSNPVPVWDAVHRWLNNTSISAADTALHLRRYAESQQEDRVNMNTPVQTATYRVVHVEAESVIKAPPERVYNAIVHELDAWWPHRFKPDSTIVTDVRAGGSIEERFTDGGSALYGVIVWLEPGVKIASSAPSCMNKSFTSFNVETFEPHAEGTLHKKSLTLTGNISDQMEAGFREGVSSSLAKALLDYCETGTGYTKEVQA